MIDAGTDIEAFRARVRGWLESEAPVSLRGGYPPGYSGNWGGRNHTFADADHKRWLDQAAAIGFTAPSWPREYGGGGYSREQARVIDEEMQRLNLPLPLVGLGLAMIGPTLLDWGSEEQKREHLPRICRGEIRWCQGYSEPSAGSDLASLRTRAVRDGDEYIVTGQKVWTSYANVSDWIFALVRTDPAAPKHSGISFLLIDLGSAGVTVRPIKLISGDSPFCETFFDEVRVPVANRIGEENAGWAVAKALLGYERKVVSQSMGSRSLLGGAIPRGAKVGPVVASRLGEWAKTYLGECGGRITDTKIRDEIAQVEMTAKALQLATRYFTHAEKLAGGPGPEGSALKLVGTELNQKRQALRMSIAGPMALAASGSAFTEEEVDLSRSWLRSRANTIEGGTSEIQLNIVAKRILEL